MKIINTALMGLGNVNRNLLKIFEMKEARLRAQYGVSFKVIAVADSSGVAIDEAGFDASALRTHKEAGGYVKDLPSFVQGRTMADLLPTLDCELLMEGSPVNLQHGEPGLSATRIALQQGISVVLANKGPLVLAYQELHDIARANNAGLAFSATVCGALPVINIGQRDHIAADFTRVRGIFNSTSNFILEEMAAGRDYDEALAEAQARGIAEADPSLDVEGWDTANKLIIIANSFLGMKATLADVAVEGITNITAQNLQEAQSQGNTIKLIAEAAFGENGQQPTLSVKPMHLSRTDFLGGCTGWEMGIELHSDLYGRMYHKMWEREPLPTAAAMLRDAVNLVT
ncbi:MAG: homoserine dehydrogenase [Chloroflexota bacterium]